MTPPNSFYPSFHCLVVIISGMVFHCVYSVYCSNVYSVFWCLICCLFASDETEQFEQRIQSEATLFADDAAPQESKYITPFTMMRISSMLLWAGKWLRLITLLSYDSFGGEWSMWEASLPWEAHSCSFAEESLCWHNTQISRTIRQGLFIYLYPNSAITLVNALIWSVFLGWKWWSWENKTWERRIWKAEKKR